MFNHGYAGLGSRIDDICGRDWVTAGGDHGDPGLIFMNHDVTSPLVTSAQAVASYSILNKDLCRSGTSHI